MAAEKGIDASGPYQPKQLAPLPSKLPPLRSLASSPYDAGASARSPARSVTPRAERNR